GMNPDAGDRCALSQSRLLRHLRVPPTFGHRDSMTRCPTQTPGSPFRHDWGGTRGEPMNRSPSPRRLPATARNLAAYGIRANSRFLTECYCVANHPPPAKKPNDPGGGNRPGRCPTRGAKMPSIGLAAQKGRNLQLIVIE